MSAPLLKICGLRSGAQVMAVAGLGVDAVGVIGVDTSPRFVHPSQRQALFAAMQAVAPRCQGVLVVADPSDAQLDELDPRHGHQVIQLHGQESPERCRELRQRLGCAVWKALRLRHPSDLETAAAYSEATDALLLDAWVPDQLGGTGHRIPLEWLAGWSPTLPWWLAGGITAARVREVLGVLRPTGLDASSGVERAPGDKNLELVKGLVKTVREAAARQD